MAKIPPLPALLALNNYPREQLEFVFCDTGFESPVTYLYLGYLAKELSINIEVLKSSKYENFENLVEKKKRFPSVRARFCTEELKVKPMIDWILAKKENIMIWQGIRQDESKARANLNAIDDYFIKYRIPKSKNLYQKKKVLLHDNQYITGVRRPIYEWTESDVFDYIESNGILKNPLYEVGFSRVGCFPCVLCNRKELKIIATKFPEVIKKIAGIEERTNSSFISTDKVPKHVRTKKVFRNNKMQRVPTIEGVAKYVTKNQAAQFTLDFSCNTTYISCE